MKFNAFVIATVLLLSAVGVARSENYYILDYTGSNFASYSFNMYGDEMLGDEYDGLVLKLEGEVGKDFSVKTRATNPGDRCEVRVLSQDSAHTYLKVIETLEVDEGYDCLISVIYKNGRRAVLQIDKTGT